MATRNNKKSALDNAVEEQVLADAEAVVGKQAADKDTNVTGNNSAKAGDIDYNPKRLESKGSSVKQEAIAKAISGSGAGSAGGGSVPYGSGMRSVPYSGTDARIIDNASGTPAFDKSDRSSSRYGQKTDNTARHINYVPSETYLLDVDGPKPLSESADRVQGALGHPNNDFARLQKCSEAFPGAVNFERSVDEITDDAVLYCQGQQIDYSGSGEDFNDIDPTERFDKDQAKTVPYHLHRANYLPRAVHVKYDAKGNLTDYYYDELKTFPKAEGNLVAERAATHIVTLANRSEIDRQAMAAKAGNEVEETWSPIPFAYPQPTRDVTFLTTIEKMLGANTFVPTKMSAKAHSYALNKASKDGMRPVSGGVEIALGPTFVKSASSIYDRFAFSDNRENNSVFNSKFTSKGAPSAIIRMLDSVAKYHDRGDLLTQPRSFNMVLKQGLSNYKTFKIDPEFARVFDNLNVFSTIDRGYDASSATCILDTFNVCNPYSFNELGSCFRTASITKAVETNISDAAIQSAIRNGHVAYMTKTNGTQANSRYYVTSAIAVTLQQGDVDDMTFTAEHLRLAKAKVRSEASKLAGSDMFKYSYAVPFVKAGVSSGNIVFVFFNFEENPLPASSNANFTLLTEYGATDTFEVNNSSFVDQGTDLVYNEYMAAYYHNRQNYYYIELRDPYTDGIKTFLRRNYGLVAKAADANGRLDWPIHYSTKSFSAYAYLVMLSMKYIQEQRSKAMLDVLNYANNFGYPFTDCEDTGNYPALGGVQYGQSDIFEPLEIRQMTPAIALRWTHPELYGKLEADAGHRTLMPFYVNEDSFDFTNGGQTISLNHERAAMSYPLTKSGVRWAYSDDLYGVSERDLRLILDGIVVPPSFRGQDSHEYDHAGEVYKYSQANDGLVILDEDITAEGLMNTARELGYVCPVPGGFLFPEPNIGIGGQDDPASDSFALSACGDADASIVGHSAFRCICWVIEDGNPASDILESGSSVTARAANFSQKYFVFNVAEDKPGSLIGLCLATADIIDDQGEGVDGVSKFQPFTDGIFVRTGQGKLDRPALFTYAMGLWTRLQKLPFAYNPFDFGGTIHVDPYSFNYLFGFLGFRASDYKEDLYNRLTKRMAEGWKYISDPFVEDSLLVK